MFLSLFLLLLSFGVNFVIDFFFWAVMFSMAQPFCDTILFPAGNEWELVTYFTLASILLPVVFSGFGIMQGQLVWSMGGRRAAGISYDRLARLLADICRRGGLGDPHFFKLYVMEDATINACALGARHIVVNTGALEQLDDRELEGILAHEMGHLQHHHTMVRLAIVGMGWFGGVICFVYNFLAIASRLIAWIPFVGWLVTLWILFITWTHTFMTSLLQIPLSLLNAYGFRGHEYEADAYAAELGLADHLIQAFKHMQYVYGNQKSGFLSSLWDDHPDTDKRIKRVQEIEEQKIRNEMPPEKSSIEEPTVREETRSEAWDEGNKAAHEEPRLQNGVRRIKL